MKILDKNIINNSPLIIRLNNNNVNNYQGVFGLEFIPDAVQTQFSNVIYLQNQSQYIQKYLSFSIPQSFLLTLNSGDYYIKYYNFSGNTKLTGHTINNQTSIYTSSARVINSFNPNNINVQTNNKDIINNAVNINVVNVIPNSKKY